MEVTTISRVIGVADMERAVGFYRDVIGLKVTRQSAEWTDLTSGDGNLALQAHQSPGGAGDVTPTMMLFSIKGALNDAIAEVAAGGGKLLHISDHQGSPVLVAHVGDTEGNGIQLVKQREG